MRSKTLLSYLRTAPLLPRLQERLLGQEHLCNKNALSDVGFALSYFMEQRCFRPSEQLLAAFDVVLLARLQGVPGQNRSPAGLPRISSALLQMFKACAWRASTPLQESLAAWLLGSGVSGQGGAGEVLQPKQAEHVLRAWVSFASAPGSPAQRTLPAVLQALDGPLAGHPRQQLGGAVGLLDRALTDQLKRATSIQVPPGPRA